MSTALTYPADHRSITITPHADRKTAREDSSFNYAGLTAKQLGRAGESYATQWLSQRDWRILDRNFRCRYGELDIVALAPNREIVFVEVKTRRSNAQGLPQEAVDSHKQANLRKAAMEWLLDESHYTAHRGTRFDVIAIRIAANKPILTHIPGAF